MEYENDDDYEVDRLSEELIECRNLLNKFIKMYEDDTNVKSVTDLKDVYDEACLLLKLEPKW
jgi:hypothetical protein